jgi:hypothetical protein
MKKQATRKRAPTASERKKWKTAVAAVDVSAECEYWNPIVEQLAESTTAATTVDRLKAIREAKGISLRALEESSGIPRGNLSRLENHQNVPTLETLQLYAAALGKGVRVVIIDHPSADSRLTIR